MACSRLWKRARESPGHRRVHPRMAWISALRGRGPVRHGGQSRGQMFQAHPAWRCAAGKNAPSTISKRWPVVGREKTLKRIEQGLSDSPPAWPAE